MLDKLSIPSATPRRRAVYAAFCLLLTLILCGYAMTGNLRGAWRGVGVPSMAPAFADIRSITHSIDCFEQGRDPYVDWGCDPWGRPYNLPPVWLSLGQAGVDSSWTNVIGFTLILSVFASFYWILGTRTLFSAIMAFFAMLSPAILLGMERGNSDFVIFVLLVLGIYASARSPAAMRLPLTGVLIVSLSVLKLYPVAAALALARGRRGWMIAVSLAVFSAAAFLAAAYAHLPQIFGNTPQGFNLSFGSGTLFLRAADSLGFAYDQRLAFRVAGSVIATGLGLAIFVLIWLGRFDQVTAALPRVELGRPADDLAIACAAMFCFVFLLGSSWNYRLIFVVGVLPVALRAFDENLNWRDAILPLMMVAFLWVSRLPVLWPALWPLDEALNWALFAALSAMVAMATRIESSGFDGAPLPRRDRRGKVEALGSV